MIGTAQLKLCADRLQAEARRCQYLADQAWLALDDEAEQRFARSAVFARRRAQQLLNELNGSAS